MNPKLTVAFDRSLGPVFYKLHRWVYAKSDGRLMTRSMGLPMVLLTTTGRKSGLPRTTTLLSYPVTEDQYAIVPSNGGRDAPPAWFLNIQADPSVQLQVKRRKGAATARVATAQEKAVLFPSMTSKNPGWAHYETMTDREIPVVLVSLA